MLIYNFANQSYIAKHNIPYKTSLKAKLYHSSHFGFRTSNLSYYYCIKFYQNGIRLSTQKIIQDCSLKFAVQNHTPDELI
jgi:hypothetical protein